MDQHHILCKRGLTPLVRAAFCCVCSRLLTICPLHWHLDQCRSLSHFSLCLSASLLCQLLLPGPHGSPCAPGLIAALFLSLPFLLSSCLSRLLSGVSVSVRQGVPGVTLGGNELLITSQKTQSLTPHTRTLPSTQAVLTKKRKKRLHSHRVLSPQREIVLERKDSRTEVQIKSLEKLLL